MQTILFLSGPDWNEGQTCSMSLNSFEKLPIEISLYVQQKLLVLGASLFEYARTKKIIFKYHIEICSKNNQEKVKHSIYEITNRNTPHQVQVFLHKHKFKILNNFIKKGMPL